MLTNVCIMFHSRNWITKDIIICCCYDEIELRCVTFSEFKTYLLVYEWTVVCFLKGTQFERIHCNSHGLLSALSLDDLILLSKN